MAEQTGNKVDWFGNKVFFILFAALIIQHYH